MKVIQRIPRTLARAVSVGVVVIAAALPLAAVGTAGAATNPATLSAASMSVSAANQSVTASFASGALYATSVTPNNGFAFVAGTSYSVTNSTYLTSGTTLTEQTPATLVNTVTATSSGATITLSGSPGAEIYPGETVGLGGTNFTAATGNGSTTGTSFTVTTTPSSALSAASVSVASGQVVYDFSQATIALGSAVTLALTSFNESLTSYAQFGQGDAATMYIYGSGFAYDGGNVTVTSNAPGLTFNDAAATETNLSGTPGGFGYVAVPFTSTSSTTPGFYSVTVADDNGTTTALANAIVVDAAPTVTSISPNTLPQSGATTVTVTGTGFTSGTTLALMASNGTMLKIDASSTGTVQGATTPVSATQFTAYVTVENPVNSGPATVGAYSATVTNPDGGTSTTANVFTVSGYGITAVSPNWIEGNGTAQSIPVTISGTDFTPGGVLTATSTVTGVALAPVYTITATSISATLNLASNVTSATPGYVSFSFTNTSGVVTTATDAVGIDQSSTLPGNAPTLTSVGTVPTLSAGSVQNLVLTGTNFAPGMTLAFDSTGTANPAETTGVCASATVASPTLATCAITVGSTWTAGADDAYVTTLAGTSGPLTAAITVAGPVITASSPASLGIGNTGTVTLTGTGFASTDTLGGATSSNVTGFTYASPTQATVTVTNAAALTNIQLVGSGVLSPVFQITAGAPVTVGAVSYGTTGASDVGVGAAKAPITIAGGGFLPGATVAFSTSTSISSAVSGIAATVTAVTPNSISATVAISSSVSSGPYYVWVFNANGGSGVSGTAEFAVGAAPLSTSSKFSQTAVIAGAKAATVTVTGGNFSATTALASSSPLLTLGTPSYNAATGALSFTASAPAINGTTAVGLTLTFTNVDGGTSTASFSINPEPTVTGTYYVAPSSTNLEVAVTGTGFEPGVVATSSNSAFSVYAAGVTTTSTGTVVTLLVTTTAAATSGTSSTITLTNPDGSTVSFPLNGGTAPKPVVKVAPKAIRMSGPVWTGKRTVVDILGVGFYGQPQITSNMGGTQVGVMRDNGKVLVIVVTVAKNVHVGVHTFTLRFANGQMTSVRYNQR